jgi:hypothetical protein
MLQYDDRIKPYQKPKLEAHAIAYMERIDSWANVPPNLRLKSDAHYRALSRMYFFQKLKADLVRKVRELYIINGNGRRKYEVEYYRRAWEREQKAPKPEVKKKRKYVTQERKLQKLREAYAAINKDED